MFQLVSCYSSTYNHKSVHTYIQIEPRQAGTTQTYQLRAPFIIFIYFSANMSIPGTDILPIAGNQLVIHHASRDTYVHKEDTHLHIKWKIAIHFHIYLTSIWNFGISQSFG